MAVKKILSVLESMRDSSLQVSFVCTLINWTHFCFHFLKWHIFLSSPFTSGQSSSTCCGLSGQGQMSPDLRVKVPDTPLGTEVEQGTALNSSSQGAPFSGKETPTPSALVLMMRRKQHNTLLLLLTHFSRVRLCDPTRLLHPWGSPGKNTGVGCHFLLQGMKVKSESEVAQSCPTLLDPMNCSLPGSSVHGIFHWQSWISQTWHLGPNNALWEGTVQAL